MPFGLITGPAPGDRIDEEGLRKKNGCFGRELFNSVIWSLFRNQQHAHATA
jgi:hypothetical protein